MTKPYPIEMRERAVRFVEAGESRHEVAARFGIAASTVIKWLARHARTGSAAPAQMGGYRPKKIIEKKSFISGASQRVSSCRSMSR